MTPALHLNIQRYIQCCRSSLAASQALQLMKASLCVSVSLLVKRANDWLQRGVHLELITCETVEKKILYMSDVNNCSMFYSDPHGPTPACNVKGLR